MVQLQHALASSKAGHGQIAGVMGEQGVGKSRLFYEFKLLSQHGCLVLETFSVSHGKAYPYLPLIDLLKNYFQLTNHDDERRRREKITGRVRTLDLSLEDTLPYLFSYSALPKQLHHSNRWTPRFPASGSWRRSSDYYSARPETVRGPFAIGTP